MLIGVPYPDFSSFNVSSEKDEIIKKAAKTILPAIKEALIPFFCASIASVFVAVSTQFVLKKYTHFSKEKINITAVLLSLSNFTVTPLYFTTPIITASALPVFFLTSASFLAYQKKSKLDS
jgi:hypothetical protein